jgi:hypothetical protein
MSKARTLTTGLALAAAGAALLMPACESVPLTAAPGTSLTLIANPEFVIANGGVSLITAILVEPAGTFVPDGVEVFFFTNLGRVDASGKTVNGVARVNFVSDSRSGTATVTAISGGEPAPAPSATPKTGSPDVGASARGTAGANPVAALGTSAASGQNSATVTIAIGSTLPTRMIVSANPQRITSPRQSTITANVYDEHGNPVQNVPVVFWMTGGSTTLPELIEESLGSGGAPQYTDSNGQARDVLYTRAPIGGIQKTITVAAKTANGIEGTVTVFVD